MSSEEVWYFLKGQETVGPFSKDVLRQIHEDGQLTVDTMVWRDGMSGWQEAGSVADLDIFKPEESAPAASPATEAQKPKLKLKDPAPAGSATASPSAPQPTSAPAAAPVDPAKHKLHLKEPASSPSPSLEAISTSSWKGLKSSHAGTPSSASPSEKKSTDELKPPSILKRFFSWLFSSTTLTQFFLIASGALTWFYRSQIPDIFWFVWLVTAFGCFGALSLFGVRGLEGLFRYLSLLFLVPVLVLFWPIIMGDAHWKTVPLVHWFFLGLCFSYLVTIWIGLKGYFTPTTGYAAIATGVFALAFTGVVSQGAWKPGKPGEWDAFVKEGSGRRLPGRLARLLHLPALGEDIGSLIMTFDQKPSVHKIEYMNLKKGEGKEWTLMIQTLDDQFLGAKLDLGEESPTLEKLKSQNWPLLFSKDALKDPIMDRLRWTPADGTAIDLASGTLHIETFDSEKRRLTATIQFHLKTPKPNAKPGDAAGQLEADFKMPGSQAASASPDKAAGTTPPGAP